MFLRLLVFISLFSIWGAANADVQVVRCAVYGSPPWIIGAEAGGRGVAPYYADKFTNVAKDMRFELVPMPYKRSIRSIRSSEVDFVLAFPNAELSQYAEPFMKIGKLALVLFSAKPIEALYEQDIDSVRMAVIAGTLEESRRWVPHWPATIVSEELNGLRATAKGRFDTVLVTRNTYEYWAEKEPEIARGYIKDVGLGQIYAWINKNRTDREQFFEARKEVEKINFNGNLVLDWYTVSLPEIPQ